MQLLTWYNPHRTPLSKGPPEEGGGLVPHLPPVHQALSPSPHTSPFPECPRRQTDILFLIDGSGSVHPSDFLKMKAFVVQVMRRFRGTETQVTTSGYWGNMGGLLEGTIKAWFSPFPHFFGLSLP